MVTIDATYTHIDAWEQSQCNINTNLHRPKHQDDYQPINRSKPDAHAWWFTSMGRERDRTGPPLFEIPPRVVGGQGLPFRSPLLPNSGGYGPLSPLVSISLLIFYKS